jgi:putative SOS response-associated peptidase YedK
MCGAYGFSNQKPNEFYNRFGVMDKLGRFEVSYNIRPSQSALIVTRNSPNKGEWSRFGIKAPWNEK